MSCLLVIVEVLAIVLAAIYAPDVRTAAVMGAWWIAWVVVCGAIVIQLAQQAFAAHRRAELYHTPVPLWTGPAQVAMTALRIIGEVVIIGWGLA